MLGYLSAMQNDMNANLEGLRRWLLAICRAFAAYGEHHSAAKLHHRLGQYALAAQQFEKAAKTLTSVNPQLSADLLQRAASSWQDAKQYHECMGVILRNPAAAQYFRPEVSRTAFLSVVQVP